MFHGNLLLKFLSFSPLIPRKWSSQEVRAVERRVLLETLASRLPPDAISFSSKLANIERSENGETLLELEDGIRISAKVRSPMCSSVVCLQGFHGACSHWSDDISFS